MKEVEIKIRNIDKSDVINKIEKLGGIKNFSGKVVDFRFDTPDRKLSKQGKALRIRQKGRYIYLNLKGKIKSVENITGRDEIGVKILSGKIMHKILNELGYIKIFELHRYRTEYKMDDVKFDIDEYLGMPPILEIESHSYETVEKYIQKLDIDVDNIGRVYIREILAAKKKYDEKKRDRFSLKDEISKPKNEDEDEEILD